MVTLGGCWAGAVAAGLKVPVVEVPGLLKKATGAVVALVDAGVVAPVAGVGAVGGLAKKLLGAWG